MKHHINRVVILLTIIAAIIMWVHLDYVTTELAALKDGFSFIGMLLIAIWIEYTDLSEKHK
jgi:predicted secreted protein